MFVYFRMATFSRPKLQVYLSFELQSMEISSMEQKLHFVYLKFFLHYEQLSMPFYQYFAKSCVQHFICLDSYLYHMKAYSYTSHFSNKALRYLH